MQIDRRPRSTRLALLAALGLIVPFVLTAWTSSAGSQTSGDGSAGSSDVEGDAADAPAEVVERQVSSDMVVDWLEAPPAGAADWRDESEGAVDHGHDPEDHGVSHTEAARTSGAAGATPGNGFAVFSASPRWLPGGYTIRLTGSDARIEEYRDEFAAAARAASAASGLPVRLAAGRGGSTNAARGEIVVVLATGPCGSASVGCGGPALTATEVVSGRVWIYPSALRLSSANRSNLAAHELGHALGLQHYGSDWSDGRQAMYPVVSGNTTYRAGDSSGLRFMAGGFDRPAGSIASSTYAAGHVHVAGSLASGSRVRVTVGSTSREAHATGGRFTAEIPAPAGAHRVCATSLDAAPGFSRPLGCVTTTAPGAPFGHLDVVANSFTTIGVGGWAIDPQTAAPVRVEVRRNGAVVANVPADQARPDVGKSQPHYGGNHGFALEIPAVAGSNAVCVRIIGAGAGGDKDLGCETVDHDVDPTGALEAVTPTDLGATVSGWALDPNTADAVEITVTVDGAIPSVPGTFHAADHRADVARNHPAHGPGHGFSERLVLTPGDHRVCLTITNVGAGRDRSLGCVDIRVAGAADVGKILEPLATTISDLPLPAVPSLNAIVEDPVAAVTAIVEGVLG